MQLPELVEIEVAEVGTEPLRPGPQHDDAQQDVEGDADSIEERYAGGEEERDKRDAVVHEEEPDDLGDRLRRATSMKKPTSTVATPTGRGAGGGPDEGGDPR